MFFSDDFIDRVCEANDIVDVISETVPLKKSGRNLLGLCPFHHEKTPSFSVSVEHQFYHCFGCGEGGRVIDFVMKTEHLDFTDAIRALAERAHLSLPEPTRSPGARRDPSVRDRLFAVNREAARFFHDRLYAVCGDEARAYVSSRGLREETIKRFGLGYAPQSGLAAHLKENGFSEQEALAAGLIGEKDGRYYDYFRNRLMFPIFDLRGNIIAFGGRVLDDSKPKYLNSPETEIFHKSNTLYGLNFARETDAKSPLYRTLLLAEGYMDVIALHQAGVGVAVAALGTSFTPEHARLLKRYADRVVTCFDSDEAGQKATLRALDILSEVPLKISVMKVTDAKDPDEFIKSFGKDAFLKLMNQARAQIEYRILLLRSQYDISEIEQKIAFVQEAAKVFAKVESEVERELYIQKMAKETGVSAEAILSEVLKNTAKFRGREVRTAEREERKTDRASRQDRKEKMLLGILYETPQLCDRLSIGAGFFGQEDYDRLLEWIRSGASRRDYTGLPEELSALVSEIAVRDLHLENAENAAKQLIEGIKQQKNRQAMLQSDARQLQQLLLQDPRSRRKEGV